MTPIAFDTETCLIRPAQLAPPMVCLTWAEDVARPGIVHAHDGAHDLLQTWLASPQVLLTAHFAAYDCAVSCAQFPDLIPAVFKAYREGRITCTKKRQQLLDIAGGVYRGRFGEKGRWIVHKYGLDDLSKRHLGRPMQKDGWRLLYDRFLEYPISQWPARAAEVQAEARARRAALAPLPEDASDYEIDERERELRGLDAVIADTPEGAIRYPLDDAATDLGIFLSQEKHAEYLKDQFRQSYADFVLYLSSTWGLRTWGPGVEALKAELAEAHKELELELQALGLVRANGVRDMAAVRGAMIEACREYGLPLRRTDGHFKKDNEGKTCAAGDACTKHVSLDADACEAVVVAAQGAETPFVSYAEFSLVSKMLRNDVKMLLSGTVYPIHTRFDLGETGRMTSAGPNISNLNTGRIKNKKSQAQRLRKGVRQAFRPREGKVYGQADFPQLELYTLAQCCMSWFGYSKLGEMLNAGIDPHLEFGARVLRIPYAEAAASKVDGKYPKHIDTARQVGKAFNFGKPGGMGNAKFKTSARKMYGVELTDEQCVEYTNLWREMLPEMTPHFARVNAMFDGEVERASVETLFTERHRGGTTYCAACNNGFQALGADCAKAALCLVAEAEYVDTASPLFGSRTVAFVHDELIIETDDGPGAHDAAFELARLMVEGANRYLPDVPIPLSKMEPTLMRMWSKDAKQVFENGRLVPWAA